MAQQPSSFAVLVRGMVMLSSLIIFPYLALTGHSLPEGLQRLIPSEVKSLGNRWLPQTDAPAEGASEIEAESAPAFGFAPKLESHVVSIPANAPLAEHALPSIDEPISSMNEASNVIPASVYTKPMPEPHGPNPTDLTENQDLGQIETQLKSLGAVAYHLEEWGSGDNMYRFVCELAVNDQQNCRRHFEAIESSPLLAMQSVLASVEGRTMAR